MIASIPRPSILVACDSLLTAQTLAWGLECHLKDHDVTYVHAKDKLTSLFHVNAPTLVLLDETMAVHAARTLSGFVAVRVRNSRLVVMADDLTAGQLNYVVHEHVSGVVSRKSSIADLARQLLRVMSGETVISEEFASSLGTDRNGFVEPLHPVASQLTNRQIDVLIRIAEGFSVREVARQLRISEKSVESHKYRAMKTLNIDDRVNLCRWAIREGLITA